MSAIRHPNLVGVVESVGDPSQILIVRHLLTRRESENHVDFPRLGHHQRGRGVSREGEIQFVEVRQLVALCIRTPVIRVLHQLHTRIRDVAGNGERSRSHRIRGHPVLPILVIRRLGHHVERRIVIAEGGRNTVVPGVEVDPNGIRIDHLDGYPVARRPLPRRGRTPRREEPRRERRREEPGGSASGRSPGGSAQREERPAGAPAEGAAPANVNCCSRFHLTTSAVRSLPSLNLTPFLMVKVMDF